MKKVLNPRSPLMVLLKENEGGDLIETGTWACGECRRTVDSKKSAEMCCKAKLCSKCGAEMISIYAGCCYKCSSIERDAERIDKMREVPDVGQPVFDGEDYYEDMETYLDHHAYDNYANIAEYVEACDVKKIGHDLDPIEIFERIEQEMTENIEDGEDADWVIGKKEIVAALQRFLDVQTKEIYVTNGKKIKVEYEKGK